MRQRYATTAEAERLIPRAQCARTYSFDRIASSRKLRIVGRYGVILSSARIWWVDRRCHIQDMGVFCIDKVRESREIELPRNDSHCRVYHCLLCQRNFIGLCLLYLYRMSGCWNITALPYKIRLLESQSALQYCGHFKVRIDLVL